MNLALSSCFATEYAALDSTDCLTLSDFSKRRIALALTECHLSINQRQPACAVTPTSEKGFSACLGHASHEAFASFTAYTLHLDSLCFFSHARGDAARARALSDELSLTQSAALNASLTLLRNGDALVVKLARLELAADSAAAAVALNSRRGRDAGYVCASAAALALTCVALTATLSPQPAPLPTTAHH